MGAIIGLTIAALVGYAIYKDAQERGMNGIFWGLAVFLLLIVALPVYLIVRKPRV